jgi:hypothetical protein
LGPGLGTRVTVMVIPTLAICQFMRWVSITFFDPDEPTAASRLVGGLVVWARRASSHHSSAIPRSATLVWYQAHRGARATVAVPGRCWVVAHPCVGGHVWCWPVTSICSDGSGSEGDEQLGRVGRGL